MSAYTEELIKRYEPLRDYITKDLDDINKTQKAYNYNEFYDITIRCTNAITRTMRYMNEHKMNYEDTSIDNHDRVLIQAVQSYIFAKCIDAENEYKNYMHEILEIFKEKNRTDNTLKEKINLALGKKKKIKKLNKEDFQKVQKYVNNFIEIGDEISSFDIEKDINKILEYFLPTLYESIEKIEINKDYYQNIIARNKIFHLRVMQFKISLIKAGLEKSVPTLIELEYKVMGNNLEKEMQTHKDEKILKKVIL